MFRKINDNWISKINNFGDNWIRKINNFGDNWIQIFEPQVAVYEQVTSQKNLPAR